MFLELSEAIPTVAAQAPTRKTFLDLCEAARPNRPFAQAEKYSWTYPELISAQRTQLKPEKYSWSYPVFELGRTLAGTRKMFLDLKQDPQFRQREKYS